MGEMTASQDRMSKLIDEFIAFCCSLENENNGLTQFILDVTHYKVREAKCNTFYIEDKFTDFAMALNDLRSIWMLSVNKFKQQEKELI